VPKRIQERPAEPAVEREVQLADNRRARFDYEIERRVEAGIALRGTEIKSLRAGRANLRDGYARVENGEVYLRNVHIAPWPNSPYDNHDPLRPRKLLLHRDEIGQLVGTIAQIHPRSAEDVHEERAGEGRARGGAWPQALRQTSGDQGT